MTPPTVIFVPAAVSGTVYDTFTQTGSMSFIGSTYYALSSVTGSWTSTSTSDGTYASVRPNSDPPPLQTSFSATVFRLEDNGLTWDTTKKIAVSFNGGTEVTASYTGTGNGGRFEFAPDTTISSSDIAPGGSLGWSTASIEIKVIDA